MTSSSFEVTTSLGLGSFNWWVRAYDADGTFGHGALRIHFQSVSILYSASGINAGYDTDFHVVDHRERLAMSFG